MEWKLHEKLQGGDRYKCLLIYEFDKIRGYLEAVFGSKNSSLATDSPPQNYTMVYFAHILTTNEDNFNPC